MPIEIPAVVIDRLPVYARALTDLETQGRDVVSSQELGEMLGVTPAQIRKDLSYFGRFGKQGRGYNVVRLAQELRQILGLDRQWSMILIGVGHLGRAILSYDGFHPQGFIIVEAFDSDDSIVGEKIAGLKVKPTSELRSYLAERQVDIGIVAVPPENAAALIQELRQILGLDRQWSMILSVPPDVEVKNIDPVLALQSMTFFLKSTRPAS